MFMTIKEISETKNALDGMIRSEFTDPEFWRREWLPFLSDGGGNYTVVDLSSEGAGRLLDFYHDDNLREAVNASVDEWITELAESMADGSYEVI
jgi:cell wall assembly regulator SMI1